MYERRQSGEFRDGLLSVRPSVRDFFLLLKSHYYNRSFGLRRVKRERYNSAAGSSIPCFGI